MTQLEQLEQIKRDHPGVEIWLSGFGFSKGWTCSIKGDEGGVKIEVNSGEQASMLEAMTIALDKWDRVTSQGAKEFRGQLIEGPGTAFPSDDIPF